MNIKRSKGEHRCKYCNRCYKIKENYNKHYVSCEFFHNKSCKDQHVEPVVKIEELYSYVKTLALKCASLENEISVLKQQMNLRQKRQILEYLNSDSKPRKSEVNFHDWYKSIKVGITELQKVFDFDMVAGMKSVIRVSFENMVNKPLLAFVQKPNYLYIYEDGLWKNMQNEDIDKMLNFISSLFLKEFVKWQRENYEANSLNSKLMDAEMNYRMKINGISITNEKRNSEIKKWLFESLNENIDSIIEFV